MNTEQRYYKFNSISCWIDVETLMIYAPSDISDSPDYDSGKPLSEFTANWYTNLENDERQFIAELLSKK